MLEERCRVLHVLDCLYWITSNYGVSTLSLDDGGKFRQPISTRHLEATTGCLCLRFFVLLCVCSVSFVSFYWSLLPLTPVGVPVVWGCPLRCVRWILCITYVALIFYARRLRTFRALLQKPLYVVAVVEFCVYLIHLSLWYCKSRQRSFVRVFWYCVLIIIIIIIIKHICKAP